MKRLIYCIAFASLVFSGVLHAQVKPYKLRCSFSFTFQKDTADPQSITTEEMWLLVGDGYSVFKSRNRYIQDSLFAKPSQDFANFRTAMSAFSEFRYGIVKDADGGIRYVDYIDATIYSYKESKNDFQWNILSDTCTINGFLCQKAETVYSGRRWIAWFTTDIAMSDGPYKFTGLPGFIVKVRDEKQYFIFSLTGITQTKGVAYTHEDVAKQVTREKFRSLFEYYIQNQFEVMAMRGALVTNGEEAIRERMELRRRKNNNKLELP